MEVEGFEEVVHVEDWVLGGGDAWGIGGGERKVIWDVMLTGGRCKYDR